MMSFINKLWIKIFYNKVGEDQFGNIYYTNSDKNYLGVNKRFVCYNGIDDGSKIPELWHGWVHYSTNEIPNKKILNKYFWQKEHEPNLSGTKHAHKGNSLNIDKIKSYSSWSPSNK